MAISSNLFERCTPAIGSSLDSCGSVTRCSLSTPTPSELESIFADENGDYRDISALFRTRFEMKMCGAKQHGLYDLLMANAAGAGKQVTTRKVAGGVPFIEPYILADQKSVIQDKYWSIVNVAAGAGSTKDIHVRSRNSSTALDIGYFPPDQRVHILSKSPGGSATRTQWKVNTVAQSNHSGYSTLLINVSPENAGSNLTGDKLIAPTGGVLFVGTVNVKDEERYCYNRPALNNANEVPFWFETNRWSMCTDEHYEKYLTEVRSRNEYFRKFGDVPLQERNKQYAQRFQEEWVNQFLFGKAAEGQTLDGYKASLPKYYAATAGDLYVPGEGRCIGYKANAVGVYEQLNQCDRVRDLQGQRINLEEFFDELYLIHRSRSDQGKPNAYEFDVMCDSQTAFIMEQALLNYLDRIVGGRLRINLDGEKYQKGKTELGFHFTRFHLPRPHGSYLNLITHPALDDLATAANAESVDSTGRFMLVADWAGIYPGIIASNRKVHRTGEIEELAKVDNTYACVMENPTQEVTLNSVTWTAIVECPSDHLWMENFTVEELPDHTGKQFPYDDLYT